MPVEWIAVPVGLLAGGIALLGLYLLARKKALKSGERPGVVFLRCIAFLGLVHGLGLALFTPCVLGGASLLFGPIPVEDRDWMIAFTLAGLVFVFFSGLALRWTGWFPQAARRGS
jgi:hypothetical protein